MLNVITAFLTGNAVVIGSGGAALGIIEYIFAPFRSLRAKIKSPEKLDLSEDTIEKLAPIQAKDGPKLSIPDFIRVRRELKTDLEKELASAADTEKDQLRARITELEAQIADPEPALKQAQTRIAELEDRLTREGNVFGA